MIRLELHKNAVLTHSRPVKSYSHQLCADTGCHQEDFPKGMADRADGERKRESREFVLSAHHDDDETRQGRILIYCH